MVYLIRYFMQFRSFVGRRIYYLLSLMMLVGLVEGIGIVLFLPILQNGFGSDKLSKAIKLIFDLLHISFSFTIMLVFILGFFVLRALFLILYARYFAKVASNLLVTLRRRMLDKIFAADYIYLLKKEIGYISNVLIREIVYVVDAFDKLSSVLKYTLYGLVYAALSLLLNFKVTLCVLAFGLLLLFLMKKLNYLTNQASFNLSASHGKFNSIVIQTLGKIKYLKATSSHVRTSKIIDEENTQLGSFQYTRMFLQAISRDAFEPFIVFATIAIVFYYMVVLKKDINEVIFLIFLFLQMARQFMNTQTSYRTFLTSRGSIETFYDILAELDENKEDLHPNGIFPDFDKNIIFKDVTIVFPGGKKALDKININIKPKSIVAFVGHSGSGKSTVANMITGIIKPTEGEMYFGGTSYEKLNLKLFRENMGYVTQEDIIFNASIKDNISLWGEKAGDDRLKKVIEIAHITRFVNDLPDKQDTMLGDNGLDISGGQRQRITIARELYKNAKLLILDEATSSLDSKSEKQIYENLKEFKGKKTLIVIAHRLSTIKNADYIYVLEDGKIVEEGAYGDLYEKRGQFQGMIDEQKLV